jgi:hypothetical protein
MRVDEQELQRRISRQLPIEVRAIGSDELIDPTLEGVIGARTQSAAQASMPFGGNDL